MKKVIIFILCLLLGAGAAFGISMAVKSCSTDETKITVDVSLLEKEYAIGDIVTFRVQATSDVELVRMTYVLNAETEQSMTVKTGTAEDLDIKVGNGKYGIDTGVEMIDTAEMSAGNYVFVVYAYDADNTRYDLGVKEVFEIINVTSNT